MSRFHKRPIATLSPRRRIYRRRRSLGRWFAVLLLLALVAVAGWWMLPDRAASTTESPQPEASERANARTSAEPREPLVRFDATPVTPITEPAPAPAVQQPGAAATAAVLPERDFRPRLPRDVFEAQIALTRDAICPGSIDGAWGNQTRAAVVAFQQKHGLRVTGQLDNTTREALQLQEPPLAVHTITPEDFLRLRPLPKGWLERSTIDRLDYSTILELVAEQHWTHPNQIRRLNPGVDFSRVTTGTGVVVPHVFRTPPTTLPTLIVIRLNDKTLQLLDADSRLLAHFPCSIARRVEKRPVGALAIEVTAPDPNYTFNPETFPDSPEAQAVGRKLILSPGPNNPVGLAWIGLTLPGYGIHGSPEPEQIGRTESSGCFRLANWNARYLLPLVYLGMKVVVEP